MGVFKASGSKETIGNNSSNKGYFSNVFIKESTPYGGALKDAHVQSRPCCRSTFVLPRVLYFRNKTIIFVYKLVGFEGLVTYRADLLTSS